MLPRLFAIMHVRVDGEEAGNFTADWSFDRLYNLGVRTQPLAADRPALREAALRASR